MKNRHKTDKNGKYRKNLISDIKLNKNINVTIKHKRYVGRIQKIICIPMLIYIR